MSSIQSTATTPVSNPSLMRAYVVDPLMKLINKIVDVFKSIYHYVRSFFWAPAAPIGKVVSLRPSEAQFKADLEKAIAAYKRGEGEEFCGFYMRKIVIGKRPYYMLDLEHIDSPQPTALRQCLIADLVREGFIKNDEHKKVVIFQVMGDSTDRPQKTGLDVRGALQSLFSVNQDPKVVFWGLTANPGDVNDTFNQMIENNELGENVIPVACAVEQTVQEAIPQWGCRIPAKGLTFPVMVVVETRAGHSPSRFGQDVSLADRITRVGVDFNGGVVVLQQIIDVAGNIDNTDTKVLAFTSQDSLGLFSAAGLIAELQDAVLQRAHDYVPLQQGTEGDKAEHRARALRETLDSLMSTVQGANSIILAFNQHKEQYLATNPLWKPDATPEKQKALQAEFDKQWRRFLTPERGVDIWVEVLRRTIVMPQKVPATT